MKGATLKYSINWSFCQPFVRYSDILDWLHHPNAKPTTFRWPAQQGLMDYDRTLAIKADNAKSCVAVDLPIKIW
jgi:hypothetical protein